MTPSRPAGVPSPWRLQVPEAFAAGIVQETGEAGAAWLRELPDLVARVLADWQLTPEGAVRHGFLGLVIPVRREGVPCVVKIGQPSVEVDNQAAALTAWDGRGMVDLLAADLSRGALLLERLDAGRSLGDADLDAALDVAAGLIRRLAVPAPDASLPTLPEHVAGWPERWTAAWEALGRPLPRLLLDAAIEACRTWAPTAGDLLVDHDLHFGNVLAAEREPWLAIDPRGVRGDPEFAVAPLMFNRFRESPDVLTRFARLVDVAGLDRDRAAAWTLVRVVDHFLWATGAGLTWDPVACRAVADRLVGAPGHR